LEDVEKKKPVDMGVGYEKEKQFFAVCRLDRTDELGGRFSQ